MEKKRKPSFEQDQALAVGRQVARANQRRRVSARQAREAEVAAAAEQRANHVHVWSGNTRYEERDGNMVEVAPCTSRECEAEKVTEVRF